MKFPAITFLFLTFSFSISAQYYYNDLVISKETTLQMKTYLINKVKTVTATGYDNNGVKKQILRKYRKLKKMAMH